MSTPLSFVIVVANATAAAPHHQPKELPFHYVPTDWICIVFLAVFGVTTIAHLIQAIIFKSWYMLPTLVLCGICELLGWGARYWGHFSPHDKDPYVMQTCTTIIAPSFMTAAMFLMLPKLISEIGSQYSRMSPRLYSIIFLTADVTALVIQAVGGTLASIAETNEAADEGGEVMLGGIIIQLVAVTLFTILAIEFVIRYTINRPARNHSLEQEAKYTGWAAVSRGVICILVGLVIATVFIFIRSIYRTIELTDGWNGEIIAIEKWFNWFDGMPIAMAMVAFNVFHPGYFLRDLENTSHPSEASIELRKV